MKQNAIRLISRLLVGCFFTISAISNSEAGSDSSEYAFLKAPNTIVVSSKGCTKLEISYKIAPASRDFPSVIQFGITDSNDFSTKFNNTFGFAFLNYNADLRNMAWKDNNTDFFGDVSLNLCSTTKSYQGEVRLNPMKKAGNYFVVMYSRYNSTGEERAFLDKDFIAIPIKVAIKKSTGSKN